MIILGIDPGIAIVGYGVVEHKNNKFTVLDYGVITTPAHTKLEMRIKTVYENVTKIITTYKPQAMAVEELFFNNNAKTAFAVGQGRGAIVLAGAVNGVEVFEYTPLQVKQALTGYGRADKSQMQLMVKMMLNLNVIPKPDDAADALAIAVCHAHSAKMNKQLGIE